MCLMPIARAVSVSKANVLPRHFGPNDACDSDQQCPNGACALKEYWDKKVCFESGESVALSWDTKVCKGVPAGGSCGYDDEKSDSVCSSGFCLGGHIGMTSSAQTNNATIIVNAKAQPVQGVAIGHGLQYSVKVESPFSCMVIYARDNRTVRIVGTRERIEFDLCQWDVRQRQVRQPSRTPMKHVTTTIVVVAPVPGQDIMFSRRYAAQVITP